jgi:hypothetical protein
MIVVLFKSFFVDLFLFAGSFWWEVPPAKAVRNDYSESLAVCEERPVRGSSRQRRIGMTIWKALQFATSVQGEVPPARGGSE